MRSDAVKTGTAQAPHRSLFNALGYTEEERRRPLIGIVCSYNEIVPGGGKTSVLSVKIENVPEADLENGTMFNVVVIYESTPVMYREDGTPYADWNVVLDNGTSQSGSAVQKEGE